MSSSDSGGQLLDSSLEARVGPLRDFFRRLADLEQAYRPFLRSGPSSALVAEHFRSSVFRACEALLNEHSQEVQQGFRLPPEQWPRLHQEERGR